MTRSEVMQKLLDMIAYNSNTTHGSPGSAESYARAYECLARCEMMGRPFGNGRPMGLDSGSAVRYTETP